MNDVAQSLAVDPPALLPDDADDDGGFDLEGLLRVVTLLPAAVLPNAWGEYAPAVARWETIRGPAPAPTEPNSNGNPRLSPRFVEWMMGLDPGHVTDTPNLPRPAQLKALGNGVVPQQAAEAYRRMIATAPEILDTLLGS